MFFIEKNRLINKPSDLREFTTAQKCKMTEMAYVDGFLPVLMELTGLVNRRTVESRTYLVYLKKVNGGYNAVRTEHIK